MTESNTQNPLARLDLQDKMTAIGAVALAIFLFFPWWSIEMPKEFQALGGSDHGVKWLSSGYGKTSLLFAVLTALWVALPALRAAIGPKLPPPLNAFMPLILSGAAFLFGPLWFLMQDTQSVSALGMKAGNTFMFYLALLSGAAMLGGVLWKKFGMGKRAAS